MMNKTVFNIAAFLLLSLQTVESGGQVFELSKKGSSVSISGTSTLHNWKMVLKNFDCTADFVLENSRLKSVDNAAFNCKVTDLKSESSLMDKKAYSALRSDIYPDIMYNMIESSEADRDNNLLQENFKGLLSIAGTSRNISLPVTISVSGSGTETGIDVKGEAELKMTDFDISPPVLMLGTLKTGDKVKVSFSLLFVRKS